MEVLALLAKHDLQSAMGDVAAAAGSDLWRKPSSRTRQRQVRLDAADIDRLVGLYVEGDSIDSLARVFGINRTTVISHLDRSGVARRRVPRKMNDARVAEAAIRYSTGLPLSAVATEFEVCDRTLRREFNRLGIPIRASGRRGQLAGSD